MHYLTTLKELFQQSVEKYPQATFLEIWDGEKYLSFTYQEIFVLIKKLVAGLANQGLKSGEKIALLGENSPGWVVCYLAIVCGGWIVVPLDKELKPKEIAKLIKFSDVKIIFVSQALYLKLERIKRNNYQIYIFNPFLKGDDDLSQLMVEEPPNLYIERVVKKDDLASIVFTSGTTGAAKGVMLTHYNFVSDILASMERIRLLHKDRLLLILPLHHTFSLTAGLFCPMCKGASIVIENNKNRVLKVFQEKRPSIFIAVPRVFELLYNRIEAEVKKQGNWEQWTKGISLVKKIKKYTGINIGKLVFSKLHKQLGGRIRLFVSGGAALPPAIAYKYFNLGLPLLQGWGMTELSPVGTILPYHKLRFYFTHYYEKRVASIGPPLDGLTIELIDVPERGLYANLGEKEGELVVTGPMLTPGYYKDEDANKTVFFSLNGQRWFKTGDVGKKDSEGNFYITGRSKYVIVTSEGKNVHPEEVEEALEQSPFIQESLVLGHKEHKKELVVALIVPHAQYLKQYLEQKNLSFTWENIYEIIYKEIKQNIQQIASYKWPCDFAITEYDENTGEFKAFEKTTTLKIKRDLYKFSSFYSYRSLKKGGWRKIFFKKL